MVTLAAGQKCGIQGRQELGGLLQGKGLYEPPEGREGELLTVLHRQGLPRAGIDQLRRQGGRCIACSIDLEIDSLDLSLLLA